MSGFQLGYCPRNAERDAVHVPIIPVTANENLDPGQKVGIIEYPTDNKLAVVGVCEKPIGYVDPVLDRKVMRFETFWLCLFPDSVSGMTHHWRNRDFDAVDKKKSEKWLRDFADKNDCPSYETIMGAIKGEDIGSDYSYDTAYEIDEEFFYFEGRDAHAAIPDEFWWHVENILDRKLDYKPTRFSCSC